MKSAGSGGRTHTEWELTAELAYDTAPVGLCVLDAELRYVRVNRRFAELGGRPATDFIGRKIGVVNPAAMKQAKALFRKLVATGEPIHDIEFLHDRKSRPGVERSWLAQWFPIKDARSRVIGVSVALEESTEHKQALDALRESEAKFRKIAENSPFGVGANDPDGRITFLNPKFTEIFGYEHREIPHLADWFPRAYPDKRYREHVMKQWEKDIARVHSGEDRHSPVRVYRIVCRDRSVKDVEVSFALATEGLYAVFNDVTERQRAEAEVCALTEKLEERVAQRTAELDAANRDLMHEIAGRLRLESQILDISEREQRRLGQDLHDEIGQQLTGIGMLASVIHRELQRQQHEKADAVGEIVEMLRHAVTSTRTLARGFYPVVLEQGGLHLALKDLAHRTGQLTGVRCEVDYRSAFRFAPAAEIHLYRIAQEALTNAVKHGLPRRIVIECTAERRVPVLRITNDGKLFKPFGKKRRGLGLHIIEYRARLIGGEVSIARGPDGGCRVTCALKNRPIDTA